MGSPYRSSYYKDAYEAASSAPSKRFHSSSGSSSHYYDSVEERKRHRLDSLSSQTSSRYSSSNDYHRSSSSSSAYVGKPSSSSYYDGSSHRTQPSSKSSLSSTAMPPPLLRSSREAELSGSTSYRSSTSSSRYLDSTSSRRYEDYRPSSSTSASSKYPPPRRAPPPPTASSGSSYSRSKSASNGSSTPTPLMKLSVEGSSKDYFGSRYRQAPPEHHRESGYPSSYSSAGVRDRRLSGSASSSRKASLRSSPAPRKGHSVSSKSLAIRKATQVTALSVTSRIRKRAVNSQRVIREKMRKRESASSNAMATKRKEGNSRTKGPEKKKATSDKDTTQKSRRKEKEDKLPGKEVNVSEQGASTSHTEAISKTDSKEKRTQSLDGDKRVSESVVAHSSDKKENSRTDKIASDKVPKDTEDVLKPEGPEAEKMKRPSTHRESRSSSHRRDSHKVEEKPGVSLRPKKQSEESKEDLQHQKALLKLQCHYCNVRCITFRDFTAHTRTYEHGRAIRKAVVEMRSKLNSMRSQQRDQQRKLEKSSCDKTLSDTTSYCRVCELNFRTDPTEHEANDLHIEIKALIYQKCDVCDIDFRVWKVYLHHLAALEHAKRFALQELQKREGRGELVKGTNLSEKELGLHLVEEKQVLYCNVCARYIPIRDSVSDSRIQHCVTFSHVKSVDDHYAVQEREQRQKKREADRAKEAEAAAAAAALKIAESAAEPSTPKGEPESMDVAYTDQSEAIIATTTEVCPSTLQQPIPVDTLVKVEVIVKEGDHEQTQDNIPCVNNLNLKQEEDDDEDRIELHADTDDDADEEEVENSSAWTRRTRSSARKASTSSKSNVDVN